MKKILILLVIVLSFMACEKNKIEEKATKIEKVETFYTGYKNKEITEFNKLQGYLLEKDKITFIMDMKSVKEKYEKDVKEGTVVKMVVVAGSFNSWSESGKDWEMKKGENGNWYLEKDLKDIKAPGNSGQAEFKFYLEGYYEKEGRKKPTSAWIAAPNKLELGYKFSDQWAGENNYLVIFEGDDVKGIAKDHNLCLNVRTEFDNEETLGNFREVTTGKLAPKVWYRSYHPFVRSRSKHSIEKDRLKAVQNLMEKNNIKSIINLTDSEAIYEDDRVPSHYKKVMDNKNLLLAKTKYKVVYFKSDTEKFRNLIKTVSQFIIEKEAPFLVHCALGSDRTGVTTAVIEAFMGATWKEISEDYEKTNETQMGEYRNKKLLKYSLERILGYEITKPEQSFEADMKKYYKNSLGFSDEEIEKLDKKLSGRE